jgi:regulator of protease activity HflC (stomatin/prohibitin superfamily)
VVNYISIIVFVVLGIIGAVLTGAAAQFHQIAAGTFGVLWLLLDIIVASGIKMAAQWEKAVVFRMGKYSSIKGPGLFFIIPLLDQARLSSMLRSPKAPG